MSLSSSVSVSDLVSSKQNEKRIIFALWVVLGGGGSQSVESPALEQIFSSVLHPPFQMSLYHVVVRYKLQSILYSVVLLLYNYQSKVRTSHFKMPITFF